MINYLLLGQRFINSIRKGMRPSPNYWRWSLLLVPMATGILFLFRRPNARAKSVEEEANEYVPIQSDSERAAGHPIVGAS